MKKVERWFSSSVGQKLLVGGTGLFLCTFLLVHLAGNLLLFKDDGGEAFEEYSEFMSTSGAIRTLEVVLAVGFLVHVVFGFRTWLKNRMARPVHYEANRAWENSSSSSRVMHLTGLIVLVFLIVHLKTFFVPTRILQQPGVSMTELVHGAFSNPLYVGFYILSMFLLGYHLKQGFQSAFQTFGVRSALQTAVDSAALIFWLLIPIGFASLPVYFLWRHLTGAI